jgi:hypothetical protein
VRAVCLATAGALMGVGGAFLTLARQNMFLIDVIGGRGWISIAMVIYGKGTADLKSPWRRSLTQRGAVITLRPTKPKCGAAASMWMSPLKISVIA